MTNEVGRRVVKAKLAAKEGLVPVSYSTLFRLASNPDSPYQSCFLYLGNCLCLDLDEFFRVGRQEARKRSLMR